MKDQRKAYLLAGTAVLFWSTVATAFKLALREMDPAALLTVASFVSFILMVLLMVLRGKGREVMSGSNRDWLRSALLGLLNPFIYYLVLFEAYSLLPAQLAQPLNMIWPLVMALLAVPLLNQRIGWITVAAMLISFFGVYLISSQGQPFKPIRASIPGILLAAGSSVLWALYFLLNARDKRDDGVKLSMNFGFACLYITLYMLLSGIRIPLTGKALIPAFYTGLFEMGFTYFIWVKALRLSRSTGKISRLIFLAPFLSLIFIHWILEENIYYTTFLGLVFIVGGILVQNLDKTDHSPAPM